MLPSLADFERSLARSPVRRRVFLMVASLSEAYPRQLAQACGIDCSRLRAVMFGRLPHYDPALGLVPLGLVEEFFGARGRGYRVTSRGRRKARQWSARLVRAEARRRAMARAAP